VEDLGFSPVHERPIKLFHLADWAWVYPRRSPFTLFVAANASAEHEIMIRRFAVEAVDAGCVYVCAWGEGCELVHDLFDFAAISADRFVMSTWHNDESLAEAFWFALTNAWPDDEQFPDAAAGAAVILAVEQPWLSEVRELVAKQEALSGLVDGEA
jgi:hypothetical protein